MILLLGQEAPNCPDVVVVTGAAPTFIWAAFAPIAQPVVVADGASLDHRAGRHPKSSSLH